MLPAAKKPKLDDINTSPGPSSRHGDDLKGHATVCAGADAANAGRAALQEDEQIQSSLPLYLDHVFGFSIGQEDTLRGGLLSTTTSPTQSDPLTRPGHSAIEAPSCISPASGSVGSPHTSRRSPTQALLSLSSVADLIPGCDMLVESCTSIPDSLVQRTKSPVQQTDGLVQQTDILVQRTMSPVQRTDSLVQRTKSPVQRTDSLVQPADTFESPCEAMRQGSPVLFPSPQPSAHVNQTSLEGGRSETTDFNTHRGDLLEEDMRMSPSGQTCASRHEEGFVQTSVCGETVATSTAKPTSKQSNCFLANDCGGYACPDGVTPLRDCSQLHSVVSLFAFVLLVNPVVDVACRVGTRAGQTVQMASLLLGDPTKSYFKLSLWRHAAVWAERIGIGDIVLFKGIRIKMWKREIVGTTNMYSSVLNLHQPKKELPSQVAMEIPAQSLEGLLQWGRERHPYLFSEYSQIPRSQRCVEFVGSDGLFNHSLVHFRAKLLALVTDRVLAIADQPGREFYLYLVGERNSMWVSRLRVCVGCVFEFTYLAVSPDVTTQRDCHSLQTTSRSLLNILNSDCDIALELLKRFPASAGASFGVVNEGLSISQVLLSKSSGTYQLRARALSIGDLMTDGYRIDTLVFSSVESTQMVGQLFGSCVYVGCGTCCKPLRQDSNGVYGQCMPCLLTQPINSGVSFQYYFRPTTFVLGEESGTVPVVATPTITSKVLGVDPSAIAEMSLAQDESKCAALKGIVSVRLAQLQENSLWTVSLASVQDENSFLESLSLSLLDWSCDRHMT